MRIISKIKLKDNFKQYINISNIIEKINIRDNHNIKFYIKNYDFSITDNILSKEYLIINQKCECIDELRFKDDVKITYINKGVNK